MNVNIWFVNERIIILVVLLLVVPTERTEDTEAYGLKPLESTDRIDATRHTTEGTEMIASAMQAIISVDSCLAKRRLFCGFEKISP